MIIMNISETTLNTKIIAFDFDGTVCEDKYPEIGKPKMDIIDKLRKEQVNGAKLILWTCRTGDLLKAAVSFLDCLMLSPDAINDNLPELKEQGLLSRKVYANIYLDDKAETLNNFLRGDNE